MATESKTPAAAAEKTEATKPSHLIYHGNQYGVEDVSAKGGQTGATLPIAQLHGVPRPKVGDAVQLRTGKDVASFKISKVTAGEKSLALELEPA